MSPCPGTRFEIFLILNSYHRFVHIDLSDKISVKLAVWKFEIH